MDNDIVSTRFIWSMVCEAARLCETLKSICIPASEENLVLLSAHLVSSQTTPP